MRTVKKVLAAKKVNMGGIVLDQPLPFPKLDQIDPFLLLHHWRQEYKGGETQKDIGVGPHPHRGFAPVTFIFEGGVYHQDSRGNRGLIEKGGTQWMNSGMGLVHSERPSKQLAENGGVFEIIQFWVNAPAKNKMDQPSYQPLTAEETPVVISEDGKIQTSVVAGEFNGIKGKINAYTNLLALRLIVKKDGEVTIPIPANYNAFIYQLDGGLTINGAENTNAKDLVWFNNDGEGITIKGLENTRAIVLAGEPIAEKVTSYGPFVMNSQTEIMEAMKDYQTGKMGVLVEEFE